MKARHCQLQPFNGLHTLSPVALLFGSRPYVTNACRTADGDYRSAATAGNNRAPMRHEWRHTQVGRSEPLSGVKRAPIIQRRPRPSPGEQVQTWGSELRPRVAQPRIGALSLRSSRSGRRVTMWRRHPGEAGPCRRRDAGSRSEGRRCRLAAASRDRSRWATDQLRLPRGRNPRSRMEHRASDGRQALFWAEPGRCVAELASPAKNVRSASEVISQMSAACKNMPTASVGASPPGSTLGGRSRALTQAPGHDVAPASWGSGAVPTA